MRKYKGRFNWCWTEGSFVCIVKKSAGHRLKWRVEIVFQIALHKKDLELLKQIQAFFGGIGTISTNPTGMCACFAKSNFSKTNLK